ncbi:MAG: 2-aminoethylphosphonate--pyruvate transaminase [Caulobacteraceae bacterium]
MTDSPILLTPGPLTTRLATRQAMLRDWGSRDKAFIALTAELRTRLLEVAGGTGSHAAIPLQGSGTFIVEAAIATLVRRTNRLLVLINGAYGERIATIATRYGLDATVLRWAEDQAVDPAQLDAALAADPAVTHVAVIHCETTTGLLNPLPAIAEVVARHGRRLIVDAMASFGALPLDLRATPVAAVLASSNKCLEGTPGLGFALVAHDALAAARDVSPSLSLDLHAQHQGFEANGQWRFTPPVQVVAALVEALRALETEGGRAARLARYQDNLDTLVDGMARLGFPLYLDRALQAPIIATFRPRPGRPFDFEVLYDGLAERGFLIYPGKLTQGESFRIGCIGDLHRTDFERLLAAVEEVVGA